MKCNWCGAGASASDKTCSRCGAPLSVVIKNVLIDLSGAGERIELTAAMTPFMTETIMPSRCFEIRFIDQTATLTYLTPSSHGGGAIAQGRNAVAAGAGSTVIMGNVSGSTIVTGNNNTVNSVNRHGLESRPPVVLSLWLPPGINYIVISGNGNDNCQCDIQYDGAQVFSQNVTQK